MRNTPNLKAEECRCRWHEPSMQLVNANAGSFELKGLFIIVSDGGGWDHVSVHAEGRCPTWEEMCRVKELFFKDDETVMQIHPAKADYINHHPYTLHLWRPQTPTESRILEEKWGWLDEIPKEDYLPIPLPPKVMV